MFKKAEKRRLRKIAEKWTVQGYFHDVRIEEYFRVMIRSARAEFREDNKPTISDFLDERFAKAMELEDLYCSRNGFPWSATKETNDA